MHKGKKRSKTGRSGKLSDIHTPPDVSLMGAGDIKEYVIGDKTIRVVESRLSGKRPVVLYTGIEALSDIPRLVHDRFRQEIIKPYSDMAFEEESGERSVLQKLEEPVKLPGITIRAVKLKSVKIGPGITLEEYFGEGRPERIAGFMDGRLVEFRTEPRPTGGMLYYRAKNEFDMTYCARKDGLPVGYPIAYGIFPGIDFQGKQVGFVVLGIDDADDKRIPGNTEDGFTRIRDVRTLMDQVLVQGRTVKLFESTFGMMGRTLRRFNDAGYIDGSPGYWNYSVKGRRVRKYDLDLTFMKKDSSESVILGYQLVDLGAAMGSIKRHMENPLPGGMAWYINRTGVDVLGAIVHGYFHDMPDDPRVGRVSTGGINEALRLGVDKPLARVDHYVVNLMREVVKKQR